MRLFSTSGILLVHAPATAVWMILLLLAVLSSAQDQVDDDTAYAKLFIAEDRSRALPGYYIVVFNESRVEDLQSAIDQIQESEQDGVDGEENMINSTARLNISITVEQQFPRLKMAKISVGLTDGDTGEDDETLMESRKTRLLSWLRSVLVDIIEEVRHMYVICIILLVLLIEFGFWWHCGTVCMPIRMQEVIFSGPMILLRDSLFLSNPLLSGYHFQDARRPRRSSVGLGSY